MIDLTGKVAIVTGGASGIGTGIARVLADQGAAVAVLDVNSDSAIEVAAELSTRTSGSIGLTADVTDRHSVDAAVNLILSKFNKIDIVVNNAGVVGASGWWERHTPSNEDWDAVFSVNLRGAVNVSGSVDYHMKERRYGKIINIASIAARQGGADIVHYSASKAAVVNWTQSLALQLAPYNVNANAICPGLLWTPIYDQLSMYRAKFGFMQSTEGLEGREYFNAEVDSRIPMKKEQTPEDIGKLAAFLASDDAHNITGQAINVDGGMRMN